MLIISQKCDNKGQKTQQEENQDTKANNVQTSMRNQGTKARNTRQKDVPTFVKRAGKKTKGGKLSPRQNMASSIGHRAVLFCLCLLLSIQ